MIVAFTGHRPAKLGGYDPDNPTRKAIRSVLRDILTIVRPRPEAAISGMALGFDQDAARVCLALDIPIWAAIPFHGQESIWPRPAKREYWALLKLATRVEYITEGAKVRAGGVRAAAAAFIARNHWMVDHSDALIAAWDGSSGGTAECIAYASRREHPMLFINTAEPFDTVDLLKRPGSKWHWNLE